MTRPSPLPVVILVSGRGSNLQAIIECTRSGKLPIDIRAVISNRPLCGGLKIAADANINREVVDHTEYATRTEFDQVLQQQIDRHEPALVILAGFMRILTPGFVQHYLGRMLNIHPSLLPDFPGLHTHQRAIDAGHTEHGASVHFVTEDTDGGPVFLQARVAVETNDTAEKLATRVLAQEHRLYPLAINWFAQNRIFLDNSGRIKLDGEVLSSPRELTTESELQC